MKRIVFQGMVVGVILVLFSGCSAILELRMLMFGEEATATVYEQKKKLGKYGRETGLKYVKYKWKDAGGDTCKGYLTASEDWDPPEKLDIEYLPGVKEANDFTKNRLQSDSRMWFLFPFFIGLIVCAVFAKPTWDRLQNYNS